MSVQIQLKLWLMLRLHSEKVIFKINYITVIFIIFFPYLDRITTELNNFSTCSILNSNFTQLMYLMMTPQLDLRSFCRQESAKCCNWQESIHNIFAWTRCWKIKINEYVLHETENIKIERNPTKRFGKIPWNAPWLV